MPIYAYKCLDCGKEEDRVKSISQIDRPEYCPICCMLMVRQIVPAKFNYLEPYWDENLADDDNPHGQMVYSYKDKEEKMKKLGHVEAGRKQGMPGCWV